MDALDYNFAHSIAVFASTSKSGEVLETRDAVLTSNRSPVAALNQCFLKTPDYKLERTLGRIDAYQQRAGVPLRLHVASEHEGVRPLLEARGWVNVDPIPAMTFDLSQPTSFEGADTTAARVDAEKDLLAFGEVAFEAFGFPVDLAPVAFTPELLALPHVELFLGREGGAPACCSMLLATGPVAGIYWVGVGESFRRRGLGAAITARAMQAARERGLALASLQASKAGEPVYRRMGFATPRHYLRFDRAPA